MVKIGIIDSGINRFHHRLQELVFADSFVAGNLGQEVVSEHGTGVVDAIRKSIRKNGTLSECIFYDIKVFDRLDDIKEQNVIDGIAFAVSREVDIINISLVLDALVPADALYHICKQAFDQGIIMVAAAHNFGRVAYPAHFPFVLGVASGMVTGWTSFGIQKNHPVQLVGKGALQRVAGLGKHCVFRDGTSYAAGHISGVVAGIKQTCPSINFDVLQKHLLERGDTTIRPIAQRRDELFVHYRPQTETRHIIQKYFDRGRFSWMKQIAVYPFSVKEFAGFNRFSDLCPFKVTDVIDFPASALKDNSVMIQGNRLKKQWNLHGRSSEADTLVIGYPKESSIEMNLKFYRVLLDEYIRVKSNFFVLDGEVYGDIMQHEQWGGDVRVYCPMITEPIAGDIIELSQTGKVHKPVMGIVGTNSQVGKFTFQLRLKEILGRAGYRVGWLSTEPQGELFGADAAFPYGYKSLVSVNLEKWLLLVHSMVKGIEIAVDPDIIISGHQAALTPFSGQVAQNMNISSLCFMSALKADAVALVVSVSDTMALIERNLFAIKGSLGIPVLMVVLTEVMKETIILGTDRHMQKTKIVDIGLWEKKAKEIKERFHLPVVSMMREAHEQTILQMIETFYT